MKGVDRIMTYAPLWDAINAIRRKRTRHAVYSLGCRCQELEAVVVRLTRRLEEIERRVGEGSADPAP